MLLPTHAGNAAPLAHAAHVLEPPSGVRLVAVTDMDALARALYAAFNGGRLPLTEAIAHAGEIETSLMLALAPAAVRTPSPQAADGADEGERSRERPATASLPASGDARRLTEAAARPHVAAFLAECLRQLEAQGVARCACA